MQLSYLDIWLSLLDIVNHDNLETVSSPQTPKLYKSEINTRGEVAANLIINTRPKHSYNSFELHTQTEKLKKQFCLLLYTILMCLT